MKESLTYVNTSLLIASTVLWEHYLRSTLLNRLELIKWEVYVNM